MMVEPVYSPAGRDEQLRQVRDEVRMGRWWRMRDLLASTQGVHHRVERTRILAEVGEGCVRAAREWAQEAPSPDADLMRARSAVFQARQLARRAAPGAGAAAGEAEALCWKAHKVLPADAVPYVCLLALAPVAQPYGRLSSCLADRPSDLFLPAGPWRLLDRAIRSEPCLSEAYLRVLELLMARQAWSAGYFCSWAAERDAAWHQRAGHKHGCALQTLPLHQRAHAYFKMRQQKPGAFMPHQAWRAQDVRQAVDADLTRAWGWFTSLAPGAGRLEDLHVLAHALWASTRYVEAARVFGQIGQLYLPVPWAFAADVPGNARAGLQIFIRAQEECLAQT
ncbi:hypothetical protein [Streptomyces sp. NRRL F-5053]|uniref:hypothetical protein n=1 Tax=Streptomyces sp. NRRL F-5053 TaxID=1463854 RepID=UPI000B161349|nr:hypothetical protein [Streptomyces sp. NRRL F-5053]